MSNYQPANSEGVRTRETLKYAGPLLSHSHRNDTSRPGENQELKPCPDSSLTAYLQLGCFKLGASRAFISLFDRHTQHVIAEATQRLPLDPKQVDVRHLWSCGTARPRVANCPDELVLSGRPFSQHEGDSENAEITSPVVVVLDLRKDDRFPDGVDHERWHGHNFYAGVPLRAKNGVNIGVYSVLDGSPRTGLDKDSEGFLREMSHTVMQYLESRAAKDSIHRGERMIRGLGSFVEGKATLTSSTNAFEDDPGQEGSLNKEQQGLQREQDAAFAKGHRGDSPQDLGHSRLALRSAPSETMSTASATRSGVVSTCTASDKKPDAAAPLANRQSVTASDPYHNIIKETFSRASNIIRESVEVEGALFLDASIGSFGGLVYGHKPRDSSESTDSPPYSSSGNEDQTTSPSPSGDQTQSCDVLGFSTGQASSINSATSSIEQVPERLLSTLLRRYPAGKIFNFDLDGTLLFGESDLEVASSSGQGSPRRQNLSIVSAGKAKKREARQYSSLEGQAKAISSIFPGARSVAVVPLWDPVKDRWFSGGMLWTNSPTRIFTVEGELSYFRAFGTTLMGEVARLNAFASDKSKSDFLSSLSHELRSPLHGVIAAVDLLNDTNIDAFQGDTVHLIETSGRTLLDTLDHLLDHSKINNYITSSKLAKRQSRAWGSHSSKTHDMGMMAKESDAQLDVLVEEVTESVFAGYNFQVMSIARVSRKNKRQVDDEAIGRLDTEAAVEAFAHDAIKSGMSQHSKREGVLVYLDIDPTVSWQYRAQPGAIRRVVMNLLGNSLKFTTNGYIWISMRQVDLPTRKGKQHSKVTLMVSDSGKGIGDEYLQNDLFSPFKQEDPLAPGTGLGLSLVRQISSTMGGSVTVTSQLGRGTTARVTLPLARPSQPVHDDDGHQELLGRLRGLSLCLSGFNRFHHRVIEETPEHRSQVSEAAVMETLCRDWLGLRIIPMGAVEKDRPDIFLYNEAAFTNLDGRAISERLAIPAVVICRDALTAHTFAKSAEKSWVTEFISQPVGPRRLARSLALAVLKWKQGAHASASSSSQGYTPPIAPSENQREGVGKEPGHVGYSRDDASSPKTSREDKTATPASNVKPIDSPSSSRSPGPGAGPEGSLNTSREKEVFPRSASFAKGGKATSKGPGQRKYLLVDDNGVNLRILCSFMSNLGYEYDTAVDGLQAVQKYTSKPELYQCILMDISMPILDGVQATRKIREHEQAERLPPTTVIALTGLGSASVRREATASGVNIFLTKPVSLKSLRDVLDEYMNGGT